MFLTRMIGPVQWNWSDIVHSLWLWNGCHQNWRHLFYFPIQLPIAICVVFTPVQCYSNEGSRATCKWRGIVCVFCFKKANINNRKMPDQIKNATWALCTVHISLYAVHIDIFRSKCKTSKKYVTEYERNVKRMGESERERERKASCGSENQRVWLVWIRKTAHTRAHYNDCSWLWL